MGATGLHTYLPSRVPPVLRQMEPDQTRGQASNEDMLRKQDKAIAQALDAIAKAKYGGAVGKSHVAAFNRREKVKRFDSADWMMSKQTDGGQPGKNSMLMRAQQGKLNTPQA